MNEPGAQEAHKVPPSNAELSLVSPRAHACRVSNLSDGAPKRRFVTGKQAGEKREEINPPGRVLNEPGAQSAQSVPPGKA